ncbi:MAG: acyl-CoA thioesterase [Ardenticatenaceae bacterium]|nr:MAG: acyl-CoA thioesterase [Ardenticatenaceae bacterium]
MIKKLCVLIAITLVGFGCTDLDRVSEAVATVTVGPAQEPVATAVPQPTVPTEPTVLAEPATALADEPVAIQVVGLEPGQTVTLRANMRDDYNRKWESEATFVADSSGVVEVGTQSPINGTYSEVDPMGLFWSMIPTSLAGRSAVFASFEFSPVVVTLTAEIDDEVISTAYLRRLRLGEGVEITNVAEDGLVGFFLEPESREPLPTLLVLSGSDGGVDMPKAVMLASRGYAVLALDYFGNEPLPLSLTEVPLEYFETAVSWLKSQEIVDDTKIGVVGTSRGGELALLLGATYPELFQVVVGYVASGLVNGNISSDGVYEKAAWTIGGEPVPFNVGFNREEATIAVEKIQAPILLISGKADRLWPSTAWSEIAMYRLAENDHPYPYAHLAYDNAGHWIGVPHWPTTGRDSITHPVTGAKIWFGGTAEADAYASADAWTHLLDFLEINLAKPD